MIIGYARVSTDAQALDAQLEALRNAGAEQVFDEKVSGARRDRPALRRLLDGLGEGDELLVTRLDRLARSTRDLLDVLAVIAERGATFRSLGDAWADTTTAHGRLMLTVLGGLAEFERELIRARTAEGRDRARTRGVRKRGIPVARLMPPEGASEARRRAAWRRIEALRADLGARDWTPGEFLSARDEGRR